MFVDAEGREQEEGFLPKKSKAQLRHKLHEILGHTVVDIWEIWHEPLVRQTRTLLWLLFACARLGC